MALRSPRVVVLILCSDIRSGAGFSKYWPKNLYPVSGRKYTSGHPLFKTFEFAGPKIRNSLPLSIQSLTMNWVLSDLNQIYIFSSRFFFYSLALLSNFWNRSDLQQIDFEYHQLIPLYNRTCDIEILDNNNNNNNHWTRRESSGVCLSSIRHIRNSPRSFTCSFVPSQSHSTDWLYAGFLVQDRTRQDCLLALE